MHQGREVDVGQYRIEREPFYVEVRGEIGLFTVAANSKMPVMLKGPTGCGKTRFVQHMAYRLGRPLITVACHEDLTASDLVGRYLLKGQETVWVDGPLTLTLSAVDGGVPSGAGTSYRGAGKLQARFSSDRAGYQDETVLVTFDTL